MSVELDNVGHKFAASPWLFRHLSARCEDGALTAIIGPSGSGKSTLLSLIAGWETQTEGTITVPRPPGEQKPRIARVFQNPFGVRARSAIDHVALPLLARGMSRAQADVEANRLLDAFNLAHLATRPFRDLSGGEAQRVLLAAGSHVPLLCSSWMNRPRSLISPRLATLPPRSARCARTG